MAQWSMEFQRSYGTMIIELREITRAMARFPVELWYDGHGVAVVYESYGMMSSGDMARFPVQLWHDDY